MTNPFDNQDKAFDVFFDDIILIEGKRKGNITIRQSLYANVTSIETQEPFVDIAEESNIEVLSFSFRKKDWEFIKKIQQGDFITRNITNQKFKVCTVKYNELFGYTIQARLINGN